MPGAPDFGILSSGNAPARTVKAGDVIFREGDAAGEMYVIKTGTVEIRVGNRVLEKLGENMIFGEMALIDSSRRSADAVAVTDGTIIPVTEKQFLWMVSQTPFFALKVMRVLAQRLRTANTAIY
jgi:CRP-like cAMP-binding protein